MADGKITMSDDKILDDNEKQLLNAMGLTEDILANGGELENYVAYAGKPKPKEEKTATEADVVEALKTVSDPEIMINIYDMGLIYKIDIAENGDVKIDMTVTAPTCPVAGILPQQAADAVALVEGVGTVEVKIVWEPAWTPERMTDEAKMMIELF